MFASLISLFIAIHVTSGKHECSVRRFKEVYEDNSRWMSPIAIDFNGNEKALLFPLAYMIPFTNATSSEINKIINLELFAHYTYLSMAMHFERDDINLPGFHKFFNDSAEKEMRDAHKFMKYQNLRGGRVKLHTIYRPCEDEWGNGLNAMKIALELEKELYESLLVLHSLASQYNDPQLQKFLVHNFLGEQVESIKQLANYVNTLNRFEESGNYQLGEYQFDKITLKGGEK